MLAFASFARRFCAARERVLGLEGLRTPSRLPEVKILRSLGARGRVYLAKIESHFQLDGFTSMTRGVRAMLEPEPEDRPTSSPVRRTPHASPASVRQVIGSTALLSAEQCAPERSRQLYELLAPYEGRLVSVAHGSGCDGAVAHHLGLLAAAQGDLYRADEHFDAARARASWPRRPWRPTGAWASGIAWCKPPARWAAAASRARG